MAEASSVNQFLLEEYRTLREEIKETKSRLYRIAALGIAGIPSAFALVQKADSALIQLLFPLLVLNLHFQYVFERRTMMRCGEYIRQKLEPTLREGHHTVGWETWLEGDAKRRTLVDRFAQFAFLMVFGLFFVFSGIEALDASRTLFGLAGWYSTCGAYFVVTPVAVIVTHWKELKWESE